MKSLTKDTKNIKILSIIMVIVGIIAFIPLLNYLLEDNSVVIIDGTENDVIVSSFDITSVVIAIFGLVVLVIGVIILVIAIYTKKSFFELRENDVLIKDIQGEFTFSYEDIEYVKAGDAPFNTLSLKANTRKSAFILFFIKNNQEFATEFHNKKTSL